MDKTNTNLGTGKTDVRGSANPDLNRPDTRGKDSNPDPITGAPGSHPGGTAVGTTAGGLAGAAAGAAIGSVVPGIGTVIGGVVGLVAGGVGGGFTGKAISEHYDPTVEDAYWRENHKTRAYAKGADYDRDLQPAYKHGYDTAARNPDTTFDQVEMDLGNRWDQVKGSSKLGWDKAKDATRDAWETLRAKAASGNPTRRLDEGQAAIPVVKEELEVGKREVAGGGVRVESRVTERPVEAQVSLHEEHVKVERRPVDRAASADDLGAFREGTLEVTEKREVPVVAKTARVVEEVVVGKQATDRTETIRDVVHETDVKVENLAGTSGTARTTGTTATGTASATGTRGFEAYDTDFRTFWTQQHGSTSGTTYDTYAPAYRYGYNLATDNRYAAGGWSGVESHAQTNWEKYNPGTWAKFKDSVRHAYEKVRGRA
jgi:uncharacterized protein (TIGR02271 family)